MKTLLLSLLCATASAQTFDYTGSTMTGTMSSLPTGATSLSQNAITGFFTAEIILQNNALVSYSAAFNASNGQSLPLYTQAESGFSVIGMGAAESGLIYSSFTGYNTVTLQTDAQGNVDGAVFNFNNNIYHNGWMELSLGATDSLSWLTDYAGSDGTCENQLPYGGGAYAGPAIAACGAYAVGTKGTWSLVSAPEIDPKGGTGAFLLLAGGLAVIRGRKPCSEARDTSGKSFVA